MNLQTPVGLPIPGWEIPGDLEVKLGEGSDFSGDEMGATRMGENRSQKGSKLDQKREEVRNMWNLMAERKEVK